jgi:hypothetical protein
MPFPAPGKGAGARPSPGSRAPGVKKYTLLGADGRPYLSETPGKFVGHRTDKIYGRLTPAVAVRSLRQSQRTQALRQARLCYDHLAGRLGVELMTVMIECGYLVAGDAARPQPPLVEAALKLCLSAGDMVA